MEQIEKLANLVNLEPLFVIIIGAGIILLVFGLGAFLAARRRRRISRAKKKALDKSGGLEILASSSKKINEPFSVILSACRDLPEGKAFLENEEVADALSELDGLLKPRPVPGKKKKTRDLSLVDYSARASESLSGDSARKPMVRILRALYMDQALYQALKQDYSGELKKAADFLTD